MVEERNSCARVAQPAIRGFVAGDDAAGQPSRIDDGEPWPVRANRRASGLEEGDVVRRIVGDENAAGGELEKRGDHSTEAGAPATMPSVMPVSTAMNAGIAVSGLTSSELPEHVLAARLHGSDLGDAGVSGASPGGLEVDDHERRLPQRRPQLVERALDALSGELASPYPAAALMADGKRQRWPDGKRQRRQFWPAVPPAAHDRRLARHGRSSTWPYPADGADPLAVPPVREPHPLRRHPDDPVPRLPAL